LREGGQNRKRKKKGKKMKEGLKEGRKEGRKEWVPPLRVSPVLTYLFSISSTQIAQFKPRC
jgi:hypothetical protein